METQSPEGETVEPLAAEEETTWSDVDLQALAEKVYALLKEELRVEAERRGW